VVEWRVGATERDAVIAEVRAVLGD
jgi:hypothetical protein